MKRYLKIKYLPLAVLSCGVLTCLLRLWLFALGEDARGLLAVGSFPDVMSWLLVAAAMALLGISTWRLKGPVRFSQNFHASLPAAIGMALAAVSFCITSAVGLAIKGDSVSTVSALFGFLSAAALLVLAFARYKGAHLSVLFHGVVCVYLMVYLVSHYRLWSSYPQLQSYAFELLAIVFVMLACYQRAAADAGKGDRRAYTFFSLAALFFCVATLPGCDNAVFFLGCAVWMYFTPCKLTLSVKKEN